MKSNEAAMTSPILVSRATEWDQVEKAAKVAKACIAPDHLINWNKAKDTWEEFALGDNPAVIYYLISTENRSEPNLLGYMRLMLAHNGGFGPLTWLVDYCTPFSYGAVVLASQETEGTVLVPSRATDDSAFTTSWPKLTLEITALERYPYHRHRVHENTWLLVPK